jgi:hypothetical protein
LLHTRVAVRIQLFGQIVGHPQTRRRTDRVIRVRGGNRLTYRVGFLGSGIAGIMLDDAPVVVKPSAPTAMGAVTLVDVLSNVMTAALRS